MGLKKSLSSSTRKAQLGLLLAGIMISVSYTNCSGSGVSSSSTASFNSSQSVGQAQVKMHMTITDSTNAVVYNDANTSATLTLNQGQNYTINVAAASTAPTGSTIQLVMTPISVVGQTPTTVTLKWGANSLPAMTPGDYSLVLTEQAPNMVTVTQTYQASVVCANPTFTAAGSSVQVTATSTGVQNVYNFSVSVSGNGSTTSTSPYLCALDPNGTGILDTPFQACSQVFSKIYVTYVNQRNVGVVVKDACNIAINKTASVTMTPTVPSIPSGINFIYGVATGLTGSSIGDARDNGTYFVTNQVSNSSNNSSNSTNTDNLVQANYASGTFTINSWLNYGMASSTPYGMQISVSGITGSLDYTTATSTLQLGSQTAITSVLFNTDQSGDAVMAQQFASSAKCTLTNPGLLVTPKQGTPCTASDGSTHTNTQFTVELWGNYSCPTLTANGATISITKGVFDGTYLIIDSCTGGGQGGGGTPPITL